MGESRQELLIWLNNLLQLNVAKVEQCGTGAALCQIFDSIYLDVPMSKVKFNVNSEYAYVQNFKVLQNTFTRHAIDRNIPVQSLIKCKMQDNLEFLQWTKKYWDDHFPGQDYDAVSRRKAAGPPPSQIAPSPMRNSTATRTSSATTARRPPAASNTAASRVAPRVSSTSGGSTAQTAALQAKVTELNEVVAGLERERDFYFNKLRDIEVMLQQEVELKPELEQEPEGLIARMQAVLYSTEEGFEIPNEEGEDGAAAAGVPAEEETF